MKKEEEEGEEEGRRTEGKGEKEKERRRRRRKKVFPVLFSLNSTFSKVFIFFFTLVCLVSFVSTVLQMSMLTW